MKKSDIVIYITIGILIYLLLVNQGVLTGLPTPGECVLKACSP
jgi:hypothetical protein